MDGGAQQPTAKYSDWNKWLWSGTLTAGCGSTIKMSDFAAKVPLSPLNKGDTVWIYVWVAGGTDQNGKNLTSYQFNKHNIEHFFCKTCGIQSFAKGKSPKGEMAAINVRCLDGIDVSALTVKHVDGKSF